MRLFAGARLGPYRILAPLGAGGMGEVYRAYDTRLGREVAIKALPEPFSTDRDRLRRFEHEAHAAEALDHPNIAAVYDIGSHEGAAYVVSELLEGETLRSRLARGPLPPREALVYAVQVANGLAAAHEKGIVHRNLKPESVFVTKGGRVKILDFGLAKLMGPEFVAETELGVVMGTVGYMSPEQASGRPVDRRSDVFAFGAIFYEMLTGRRAFRGDTAVETLIATLEEQPEELSTTVRGISPALERVVRRCLEKGPEKRFQSAGDLALALSELSEAVFPGIEPARAAEAIMRPVPVIRRQLLLVVFAAVVVVIGAALFFLVQPKYMETGSAEPRKIREAFWNNWIQSPGSPEPVSRIEVGGENDEYHLNFDLAAFDYSTFWGFPTAATIPVDDAFRKELDRYAGDTASIRVKPVLGGRGLEFLSGEADTRTIEIDLARLRTPPADWSQDDPLPRISEKVRAAQVRVGVKAMEKGCASIGLSIWNNALERPIEHLVRNVNVGGDLNDPACVGKEGASKALQGGRLSLLAIRPDRRADAALHVFEMAPGSSRPRSYAVFAQGEGRILSWVLERQLTRYVTEASGLLDRLAVARSTQDYRVLADELTDVLFHGDSAKGQDEADRAKEVLAELAARPGPPTVFIRIADLEGRNAFLPLGLVAVGGRLLGDAVNVVQPLPRESYAAEGRCIDSWRVVLPEALTGVDSSYLKPVVTPLPNRISAWPDLTAYLGATPPANARPEGLVLLAHQSGGRIWFIEKTRDSIVTDHIKRQFPAGSVAVLAACEVGKLSQDSSGEGLLVKLNDLGVDAAIVSPFSVQGPLGARFAFHFTNEMMKAQAEKGAAELGDLFRRAVEATKKDGSVAAERNGVNEFLLAGNSGLRLCR